MKNIDELVMEWRGAQTELEIIKEKEMRLRKEIAYSILDIERKEAYSKKHELGRGYFLKATQVINYKLDALDRVELVIDKLSEMGKANVSSDVFKWKPTLSETNYKTLDPETKNIVDECVSFTIGAPKLEFIEPKVKL